MSLIGTMLEASVTFKRPTIGQEPTTEGTTQDPFVIVDGAQDLPCSYQEPGASAQLVYGQRNTVLVPTIYLAADPGTEVNDIGEITQMDGSVLTVKVTGEAQPVARFRLWSVECERIREPS